MPGIRTGFPGSLGVPLAARLDTPDTAPVAWALFAHCFTCSKDSKAASTIARALAASGIGVLRFDFTGLGGSGGDFANTHFSSNVDDLVAAAGSTGSNGRSHCTGRWTTHNASACWRSPTGARCTGHCTARSK
jgi:hypothetical protein